MPDVNVLVYAHRADDSVHLAYRAWLEDLVNGPEPFALSALVAVGFVRIVSNPRIFAPPTPIAAALAVIDALVGHPSCRMVVPDQDLWNRVSDLCRKCGAAGKAVADAQHAAIAIAEGARWVSRDGDFAQFAPLGLDWEHLVLS